MKTTIIIIVFVCGFFSFNTLTAQQQPMYSQYMLNDFLLNPAIAGTTNFSPIALTTRQQWMGIEDAPSTTAISGHTFLGRNNEMGAGGFIYSDAFGPISRTGIMGTYSYKVKLQNETRLSFGLSLSAFQFKLNESDFNIIDEGDLAFTGATETKLVPDANFGMYLYNPKYYVGYTSAQLFQFQIKIAGASDMSKIVRHHYLLAGYKFTINEELELEPSLMLKSTEKTKPQFDFNAKLIYKENYWLGFSYRTEDAIIAVIGLKLDKYYLGYAFDYTTSTLSNCTYGSHEILIGYQFVKKGKSNTLF